MSARTWKGDDVKDRERRKSAAGSGWLRLTAAGLTPTLVAIVVMQLRRRLALPPPLPVTVVVMLDGMGPRGGVATMGAAGTAGGAALLLWLLAASLLVAVRMGLKSTSGMASGFMR